MVLRVRKPGFLAASAPSGSVGTADGTSTATAIGEALASAQGAANGSATASAVGAVQFLAQGKADGTSTAEATSQAQVEAAGSADGTSTAEATGQAQAEAVGSADGTSTASGVPAGDGTAIGTASGSSTAAAVSVTIVNTVGTADGTSTATAIGEAVIEAIGSADGTSTASAVGEATVEAAGSADGTSTAEASATFGSLAVGNASGSSAAKGVSLVRSDMFGVLLQAVRDHLAEQTGVQEFLGVDSKSDALSRIYLYEYPLDEHGRPRERGNFLLLERGQNWTMTRERLQAGRHFSKQGSIDMYWNYPIDGESPESEASESILTTAWGLIARLMDAVDSAPRIAYSPASIHIDQVDLTEWWRPTADDAESEGDKLEGVFTMQYGTGA